MTHDEAKAQIADLFAGNQATVRREALRAHLTGCEPCKAFYDATATAMRRILGAANEMGPDELWLFEPPLPAAKVVPLFRAGPAVGLAIAATLAAVVLWYGSRADDFGARGGPKVTDFHPSARTFCLRGDTIQQTCAEGDTVMFTLSPQALTHVKVLDGANVVGEGDVADAVEVTVDWSVPFRPGLKLTVQFSKCATCDSTAVTVAP